MPIINKIKMLGHGGYNKYKLCSSINDLKIVNQYFENDFYNDIKSLMSGRKYCVGFNENSIIVYADDLNDGEHGTVVSIIGGRLKSDINVIVSSYQGLIDLLRSELTTLLGEGNFELTSDNDSQKIMVALALTTTQSQIEAVNTLFKRVVPQNLHIDVAELPMGYMSVEYLESSGTQYISTAWIPFKNELENIEAGLRVDAAMTESTTWRCVTGMAANNGSTGFENITATGSGLYCRFGKGVNFSGSVEQIRSRFVHEHNYKNTRKSVFKSYEGEQELPLPSVANVNFTSGHAFRLFGELNQYGGFTYSQCKIWSASFSDGSDVVRNFLPCIDPTGAPCMFDTVTRKLFYNSGTGDLIYPTDAPPAVSADLDEKFYAKLTEHGVRRLYHVPHGYTGSKDQYAAENGYKEIIEPPMPLQGYWTAEWRETETQLILEWVEAEHINTEEHE